MIDATVAPKVGFISPFGTTACNVNHINAGHEPRASARRLHALVRLALFGPEPPVQLDHLHDTLSRELHPLDTSFSLRRLFSANSHIEEDFEGAGYN
jgi:hypothetical protein